MFTLLACNLYVAALVKVKSDVKCCHPLVTDAETAFSRLHQATTKPRVSPPETITGDYERPIGKLDRERSF